MSEAASTQQPSLNSAIDRLSKLCGFTEGLLEKARGLGHALQYPPPQPPSDGSITALVNGLANGRKETPMPSAIVPALHDLIYSLEQRNRELDTILHHIHRAIGER